MNAFIRSVTIPVLTVLTLALMTIGCGSSNGGRPGAIPSNQVSAPSFDRPSGYFVDPIDVTISPGTAGTFGDTIVYTRDNTDPSCASGTAYASTTVTISAVAIAGTVTTIKAVACMDGYDDSDILVATYTELVANTTVSAIAGTPITRAIRLASPGDVIYLKPGTYTENNGQVTINKRVTLIGAGSGAYGNSITTITDQPTSSIIAITSGGASATSRLAIRNLQVTGSTGGGGNAGAGILINTWDGHIEFDNVSVVANSGYGIGFNPGAGVPNYQDIVIKNSDISFNGSMGFRIPTYVGNIDGLYIDNCVFQGNGSSGVEFLQMGIANADSTNIFLTNSTFIGNASGLHTASDVMFTEFGGNATISTVSITSSGSDTGIRISGYTNPGTSSPNKVGLFAAGDIALSNIDIGGFQQANGSYPSGALVVTRFLGLGNLSVNNVNLNSTAPNGLFLGTIAAGASTAITAGLGPDLGDLILDGVFTDDIRLGKHGNSGSYLPTDIDIVATGVTFQGAVTDQDIEDRIWHNVDEAALGLVSWTTP